MQSFKLSIPDLEVEVDAVITLGESGTQDHPGVRTYVEITQVFLPSRINGTPQDIEPLLSYEILAQLRTDILAKLEAEREDIQQADDGKYDQKKDEQAGKQ